MIAAADPSPERSRTPPAPRPDYREKLWNYWCSKCGGALDDPDRSPREHQHGRCVGKPGTPPGGGVREVTP